MTTKYQDDMYKNSAICSIYVEMGKKAGQWNKRIDKEVPGSAFFLQAYVMKQKDLPHVLELNDLLSKVLNEGGPAEIACVIFFLKLFVTNGMQVEKVRELYDKYEELLKTDT